VDVASRSSAADVFAVSPFRGVVTYIYIHICMVRYIFALSW